ncbi:CBS domain-containing protein [Methanoregula sp.]|uniref:CBS domain-containing protein n=1 Tax=Methanoregula sp. TaxID=2052170 RepID=UPI0035660224
MDDVIQRAALYPVTDVMTSCPLSVHPETPVPEILDLFSRPNLHQVLVIGDDEKVYGVITTRDIIAAVTPGAGSLKGHQIAGLDRLLKSTASAARDLVSDEPLSISMTATLLDALKAMEHSFSPSLIVVDKNNRAVGCVNLAGILSFLTHHDH